MRNAKTDHYEHDGLAAVFGRKESNHALRQAHEKAFLEWLGFTLEKQKADLDLHLSGLGAERRTAVREWLTQPTYHRLIPASARTEERQLFLSAMGILLNLPQAEYGVSRPVSAA